MTKLLTSLLLAAAATTAAAAPTPQDHHCKLADGTFDGGKTHKECDAAKGEWAKDATISGKLATGIVAIGGETTGIQISTDKDTYELDVHGDANLEKAIEKLANTKVTVTGYLTIKKGVEIKERQIFVVSTLTAKK